MADYNKHNDLPAVALSGNKTLAAVDQGTVQDVTTDAVVLSLPAVAAGLVFIVRNKALIPAATPGAVSGKRVGFTIVPNGVETVSGFGITPAAGKGLQFVKLLSVPGDYVKLSAGAGTWNIEEIATQNTGAVIRIP